MTNPDVRPWSTASVYGPPELLVLLLNSTPQDVSPSKLSRPHTTLTNPIDTSSSPPTTPSFTEGDGTVVTRVFFLLLVLKEILCPHECSLHPLPFTRPDQPRTLRSEDRSFPYPRTLRDHWDPLTLSPLLTSSCVPCLSTDSSRLVGPPPLPTVDVLPDNCIFRIHQGLLFIRTFPYFMVQPFTESWVRATTRTAHPPAHYTSLYFPNHRVLTRNRRLTWPLSQLLI